MTELSRSRVAHTPRAAGLVLRLLAALALALAPLAVHAQEQSLPIDPIELQEIQTQVMFQRGLDWRADVPLKIIDRSEVRGYFERILAGEYSPEERDRDKRLFTLLGFVRPGDDLIEMQLAALEHGILGIYDSDQKVMNVVSGAGASFGEAERLTFVHEFTHALQDQNFDLGSHLPKRPEAVGLDHDHIQARRAVVEGDAHYTEMLWDARSLAPVANTVAPPRASASLDQLSDTMSAETNVFAARSGFFYLDGARLVARAVEWGGGMEGANVLWQNPPRSTEQVLHPDKYLASEEPIDVTLPPDLAARLGPGWHEIANNVLGEADLQDLIRAYTPRSETVRRAAAGWGGDRWVLIEKVGEGSALILRTTWDTETDAREFYDAYAAVLRRRFAGLAEPRKENVESDHLAIDGTTWTTDLQLTHRDVLWVISYDRPSLDALLGALSP